jgi:DNA anti-recombination protein RmuC
MNKTNLYAELLSVGCCPKHWGIEHKSFVTESEEKCWACLIDKLRKENEDLKAWQEKTTDRIIYQRNQHLEARVQELEEQAHNDANGAQQMVAKYKGRSDRFRKALEEIADNNCDCGSQRIATEAVKGDKP